MTGEYGGHHTRQRLNHLPKFPNLNLKNLQEVLNLFQNRIQNLLSPELSLSQTKTQFRIIQTPKELKISLESSPKVKHHKSKSKNQITKSESQTEKCPKFTTKRSQSQFKTVQNDSSQVLKESKIKVLNKVP